ncbi:glutamine--fructose-6-phosphate transaminase (isomerizing) [Candidatus Palibaumannia cicadellinicola]|uniref:Glutamine--fructose-6-phosphate aminotransferase [isomerizing] n=1 Tax=Baumannia cicadellinicola subsp. Homalodisca coagulata TaxID=374463 RepID=Q1LTV7_BAUCH|nr:glutamine--fructose-6-phosphate transaminase (isomerizing) [Candidatus Baumannia cicadellinicola]ABF14032.1 glucosamine--fructose-6-phosphate aminotransferase, isomerizing [Baumannia cicadellinicola str. Hc (Homalodisca coagulata)]MBS0032662.1 glutamine--fructose-6-phosphate transaminase (isomerizing) [Candidatus Baumannia cicadellinicola]MCJ7462412.1 glutamine--fructose-6-phosphate transaminase (isomerizing) [Candidatus Baumannia cicadellinicola]MCJ7462778.1 glutamine--fructose-6-phosphate 
MCGIVGAVAKREITEVLLQGLHRLEYRGYDSAGLAVISSQNQLQILRKVGKVNILTEATKKQGISGQIGIAHTRWATHGDIQERNAHPHVSSNIIVVHNGIIENYQSLRQVLSKRGYSFFSDTDTEIIAHLVHWEQCQTGGILADIIQNVIFQLHGNYSIVIMDSLDCNKLVAVCSGSTLIIGCGDGENFIASDKNALLPVTCCLIFLETGDIAEITSQNIKIRNHLGNIVERSKTLLAKKTYIEETYSQYRHYMQKEIFEQPCAIQNTIAGRLQSDFIDLSELGENINILFSKVQHVQIIACGTSYHSAMISRFWLEKLANLPCDIEIASEFRYRELVVRPGSLLITISQSGETADTLAALRLTKNYSGYLGSLTICNTEHSTLVRESDFALITYAGSEISVASTKTFTAQLTLMLILITYIARIRGMEHVIFHQIIRTIEKLPRSIEQILSLEKEIKILANKFIHKKHALFLGRGSLLPIAMEGALKLKETAYIHAEAYAAGELKHGPLALINDDIPVIVIVANDYLINKVKSNIEEVHARGGKLYIFAEQNTGFIQCKNINITLLPKTEPIIAPIIYAVPMQMLAYYIAVVKGNNVDQPRHLAKSVTVE